MLKYSLIVKKRIIQITHSDGKYSFFKNLFFHIDITQMHMYKKNPLSFQNTFAHFVLLGIWMQSYMVTSSSYPLLPPHCYYDLVVHIKASHFQSIIWIFCPSQARVLENESRNQQWVDVFTIVIINVIENLPSWRPPSNFRILYCHL